jgi:cytochrome c oxidase subunit 2
MDTNQISRALTKRTWHLWRGAWLAAGVVGIFTAILILLARYFGHRRKEGDPQYPKQTQYNIPVEVAYTVIPFIIVAVLFFFTARDEATITAKEPAKVMHTIHVTGIQWSWQFGYQDGGHKNGTNGELAAVVTGTPANPPTLVLPQGERVAFNIYSNDVVHGFWIPAFMIQIQNLPGVTNHLEFTANKLGEYPGRCNILCGRNHSQMVFKVKVVTPTEYKTYVESLKAGA